MNRIPFHSIRILSVAALTLFALGATAQQFKKPVISSRDRGRAGDAQFNVGLVGGGNLTTWLHFHSAEASDWFLENYKPFDTLTHSMGFFGGIALEHMLTNNFSIGLNAVYAQHNVALRYEDDNFPIRFDEATQTVVHGTKRNLFRARYHAVEAYIPLTFYLTLSGAKNVRPYVYVAPRVSYQLPDSLFSVHNHMTLETTYLEGDGAVSPATETTGFDANTYKTLNVGATVGIGSQFRIETSNYYFAVKFDLSANMYGLSSFTDVDLQDEFKHLRHGADAHASLTVQLPIKKRLKGACMNWGEYD